MKPRPFIKHPLATLTLGLLAVVPGWSGEPPATNKLQGVVIPKGDDQSAAGVPVLMARHGQGYVYFAETGLQGRGENEKILGFFVKQNSKNYCITTTDNTGRFAFYNFTAPGEQWILAAGDQERGYNMSRQDLDGDGEPELIMPNWQGEVSIVYPATGEVTILRLCNSQRFSVQSICAINIDNELCWLCAGTEHGTTPGTAMKQRGCVRLHAPGGEVLWTYKPELEENTSSSMCAAAGDLDGDGIVEYAIGLSTYTMESMGENRWTQEDLNSCLMILSQHGQLIAQHELPSRVELLHIPTSRPGKQVPLLCFYGSQLEQYRLQPRE